MGEALGQPWPDPRGIKLKKIIDFDTHLCDYSGVFRILILRVPSVNRIFPLRVLTVGAISLFLNIANSNSTRSTRAKYATDLFYLKF